MSAATQAGVGRRRRASGSPSTSSATSRRWSPSPRPPATSPRPRSSARWSPPCFPDEAEIERPPCSTPASRPTCWRPSRGTGSGRVLLLGHLDTVVAHAEHRPLERHDGKLVGSGTVDMKGGVALALGVMRALAAVPESFAELSLLDGRRRGVAHRRLRPRPALRRLRRLPLLRGGPARARAGRRRWWRSARPRRRCGSVARGVAAHSGSSPEKGRNALLALGEVARRVAALNDPAGPERLTAMPTVLHSRRRLQRRPAEGELVCDLRAERLEAFEPVLDAVPGERRRGRDRGGAGPAAGPGWTAASWSPSGSPRPAAELLGAPVRVGGRGGASDASHMAEHVALTVDGLGPRGGHAHHPDEFVASTRSSRGPRSRSRSPRRRSPARAPPPRAVRTLDRVVPRARPRRASGAHARREADRLPTPRTSEPPVVGDSGGGRAGGGCSGACSSTVELLHAG